MSIKAPTTLIGLLSTCYRNVFPAVHKDLNQWQIKAQSIPNKELRKQALDSINAKTFHCEGGSIYATLAGDKWRDAIQFIIAYQTISDYLDNLCDRSTSLDPSDFRHLHRSMQHAISPQPSKELNYYELRDEQNDDGYLQSLVNSCQEVVQSIDHYDLIYPHVSKLTNLYIDLQVHKHVVKSERVPRLENWYNEKNEHDDLSWYEFSAVTGSTIGIFCLISYALNGYTKTDDIMHAYFPYMQGLHILLDYFIDQKEDEEEGDLNFCFYYESKEVMVNRLKYFIDQATENIKQLPNSKFHQLVKAGLVGLYLSDFKTDYLDSGISIRKELLQHTGYHAKVIYWNGRAYRKWKEKRNMGD